MKTIEEIREFANQNPTTWWAPVLAISPIYVQWQCGLPMKVDFTITPVRRKGFLNS